MLLSSTEAVCLQTVSTRCLGGALIESGLNTKECSSERAGVIDSQACIAWLSACRQVHYVAGLLEFGLDAGFSPPGGLITIGSFPLMGDEANRLREATLFSEEGSLSRG